MNLQHATTSIIEKSNWDHDYCKDSCPTNAFFCAESALQKYLCKTCDFTTNFAVLLLQHVAESHTNRKREPGEDYAIKMYSCTNCDTFQTFSLLQWLKHKQVNCLSNCAYCSFKSTQKHDVETHLVEKHSYDEATQQFRCLQCRYKTKIEIYLKQHVFWEHGVAESHYSSDEVKWFNCDQCSYQTEQWEYLAIHKNLKHSLHNIVGWFYCDQCNYRAMGRLLLQCHKRTVHASEQWFKCDQCSYKSKTKIGLRVHAFKRHTVTVHAFKRHTVTSDVGQLFHCDQCAYWTKRCDDLKIHKILMHKSFENSVERERVEEKDKMEAIAMNKWYKCGLCEYKSTILRNLKPHQIAKHPSGQITT